MPRSPGLLPMVRPPASRRTGRARAGMSVCRESIAMQIESAQMRGPISTQQLGRHNFNRYVPSIPSGTLLVWRKKRGLTGRGGRLSGRASAWPGRGGATRWHWTTAGISGAASASWPISASWSRLSAGCQIRPAGELREEPMAPKSTKRRSPHEGGAYSYKTGAGPAGTGKRRSPGRTAPRNPRSKGDSRPSEPRSMTSVTPWPPAASRAGSPSPARC